MIDLPECPVCLQVYDIGFTIPRVLSCGHSACQTCLNLLPHTFPNTLRCPACTQLVPFPSNGGATSLPKNIDLLRLIPLDIKNLNLNTQSDTKKKSLSRPHFVPNSWSYEFYADWKEWIVPNDTVSMVDCSESLEFDYEVGLRYGRVNSSPGCARFECCLRGNQMVSMVPLGSSVTTDSNLFTCSYAVRIIEFLGGMSERERSELGLIMRTCSRQARVPNCLGLWYNSKDSCVYLVCEEPGSSLLDKFEHLGNKDFKVADGLGKLSIIGMEICESLISLHSEELVTGCVGLSCFKFDDLGRTYVDLNEILVAGRKVCEYIADIVSGLRTVGGSELGLIVSKILENHFFVSPEVLRKLLQKENIFLEFDDTNYSIDIGSDAWQLGCVLLHLVIGNRFTKELIDYMTCILLGLTREDSFTNCDYMGWVDKIDSLLGSIIIQDHENLQKILCNCFHLNPRDRPLVSDVWKCFRGLIIQSQYDIFVNLKRKIKECETRGCVVLGELCRLKKRTVRNLYSDGAKVESNFGKVGYEKEFFQSLSSGNAKILDLQGHLDCITGLAVCGDFLLSSSFDKTVRVWSLKDFAFVHSFRGHEHKVMAIVVEQRFCITGDSGGGIFIWGINVPFNQEPIKKWYEQQDWRYSGIHALAVSGSQCLYTGSGDKLIKVWSLQDYTLSCTMSGHKSVVSTLAVCDGVLYSGSWDGTIRIWSLNDHSILAVLGEELPGSSTSVLCLAADHHLLVAAHENGTINVWKNDVIMRSKLVHDGAIVAVGMEGKWLFSGGWDKTLNVQELCGDEYQIESIPIGSIAGDSVITALLYWQGNLFVGLADRQIKVYYYGD